MPPYLPRVKFPPWLPDKSDQEEDVSVNVLNVIPRSDGWLPFPSFSALNQALPAPCRGFFFARNTDGTIVIFAGTNEARLYVIDNTTLTWTDVSQGGAAYSTLPTNGQWQFAQFKQTVIAVQQNCNPQEFVIGTGGSTAFTDLGGSPPQAAYVAVVNQFVVLTGIKGTVSGQNGYTILWSDLDGITTWTPGVRQCDFQDLPDGGITLGVAGFDQYGVVFQSNMARLLTYAPGSPVIFTITKITGGDGNGLYAPYGWVIDQDQLFWLSQEGFKQMSPGWAPSPIGKEMVDRYFFANVDSSSPGLIIATTDPAASRMYFAFKSQAGQQNLFDTIIVFDWQLKRWGRAFFSGEWITVFAKPSLTLEGLDATTPGALAITNVDAFGGNIRLTVGSTAALTTGQTLNVTLVQGDSNLNNALYPGPPHGLAWDPATTATSGPNIGQPPTGMGTWTITVLNSTQVTLNGSTFAGTYHGGGVLGGNLDLLTQSWDSIASTALPALGVFNSSHQLGFFTGPPLEATIETGEQGGNDRRLFVKGFRVICDASRADNTPPIYGRVSFRDNPQQTLVPPPTAAANQSYTAEVPIDITGTCLVQGGGIDTRYSRARIRIPAGTVWTYATAIEPDGVETGSY